MITGAPLSQEDNDAELARVMQIKLAVAANGFDDAIVALAALSLLAISVARMAVSPDDAVTGARSIVSDLETDVRDLWLRIHGAGEGGTG